MKLVKLMQCAPEEVERQNKKERKKKKNKEGTLNHTWVRLV